MTDFYAELERHLHDAARRRARRRWLPAPAPRAVFAVAVAAAAAIAIVASLSAIVSGGEPEVAAPAPAPAAVTCDGPVPAVLTRTFSVLRRPPDRMPRELAARIGGDLPGGPMARVWTADARRVEHAHATYWVVPAATGDCDGRPEPAMCVLFVHDELTMPGCASVADVRDGNLAFGGKTGDGRWFSAALVPDGHRFGVEIDGRRENGAVGDNVGEKAYEATTPESEHARVFVEPRYEPPPPASGCFSLTDDAPDPRVLRLLPMFEDVPGSERAPEALWAAGALDAAERKAVGVHAAHGRRLGVRGGWRFVAVPVTRVLPAGADCRSGAGAPGACASASSGDGAATETRAWCWDVEQIERGAAKASVPVRPGRAVSFALSPSDNFAFGE